MKNNNAIYWVIGIAILSLIILPKLDIGLFSTTEFSMSRSVPLTSNPGQQFNIVYSSITSGTWGASIVDSVSGGCTFPDGSSQLKTVMLSTDGTSKIIKVTAPSSGSCTFSGDYKFGTEATKNFLSGTVVISTEEDEIPSNGDEVPTNGGLPINGNDGIPTFDINKVLFKIGDFEVTILILLIGFGGLFTLSFLKK